MLLPSSLFSGSLPEVVALHVAQGHSVLCFAIVYTAFVKGGKLCTIWLQRPGK